MMLALLAEHGPRARHSGLFCGRTDPSMSIVCARRSRRCGCRPTPTGLLLVLAEDERCRDGDAGHHRRRDAASGQTFHCHQSRRCAEAWHCAAGARPPTADPCCTLCCCRAMNRAPMRCWNWPWPAAGIRTGNCFMATRSASVRSAGRWSRSSSPTSLPTCCCPRTILAGLWVVTADLLATDRRHPGQPAADGEYDLVLRCVEQAGGVHHVPKAAVPARRRLTWMIPRRNRRRWSGA